MAKPIRLRKDGTAVVKMGFDNSVDARNFVAQIAHLVSYEGPDSKEIVFQFDAKSIRQAAEWGLGRKAVVNSLRELSQEPSGSLPHSQGTRRSGRGVRRVPSDRRPQRSSADPQAPAFGRLPLGQDDHIHRYGVPRADYGRRLRLVDARAAIHVSLRLQGHTIQRRPAG